MENVELLAALQVIMCRVDIFEYPPPYKFDIDAAEPFNGYSFKVGQL